MMKKVITTLVGLLMFASFGIAADDGYSSDGFIGYGEDAAPAIRIYNSGSEVVKIQIVSNSVVTTNQIVIGDIVNTIDGTGATYDTIAEFAAAIAAATNSAGKKVLKVDTDCVVATTESTDGELLDCALTANQIQAGTWGQISWDTSVVKHYRTYVPKSADGAKRGGALVQYATGNAGGTGDVGLKVYKNGTKVIDKAYDSPVYSSADGTVFNTNAIIAGVIEVDLGVYIGQDDNCIVEATRATTATTGSMGVKLRYK